MAGHVWVTEFRNYGDVQWETAILPINKVTKIEVGVDDMYVDAETRMVWVTSTARCRVAFIADNDPQPPEEVATPLPPDQTATFMCNVNTRYHVISFDDY